MESLQKFIAEAKARILAQVHGMCQWLLGVWAASIATYEAIKPELRTRISTSLRALGVKKDDTLQ